MSEADECDCEACQATRAQDRYFRKAVDRLGWGADPVAADPRLLRMEAELAELEERAVRLQAFINGDTCPTLPREERTLLHIQHRAMLTYAETLSARIDLTKETGR